MNYKYNAKCLSKVLLDVLFFIVYVKMSSKTATFPILELLKELM